MDHLNRRGGHSGRDGVPEDRERERPDDASTGSNGLGATGGAAFPSGDADGGMTSPFTSGLL